MAELNKTVFDWFDYAIFAAFLLISLVVGLYYMWQAKKSTAKTDEFLMGGRKMPIFPIALSVMATFLSGITLLGTPAEVYERGLLMWIYYLPGALSFIFCAVFVLPVMYRLKPTSVYEYLGARFQSMLLRRLASALFLVNTVFYLAVALYAPAVALSAVTELDTWYLLIIVGITCTCYTTIGGLKAVVWTDSIQAFFMYTGILTLIVNGTIEAGGVTKVFQIASDGGRIAQLGRVDLNPAQYSSLWIALFGGWSFYMTFFGINQMSIQRYCAMPSVRDARRAIAITIPLVVILATLCSFIGLVMLAYFVNHNEDPLATGQITSKDQLVVLFASRVLRVVPGFPGLFLACIVGSTLSTVSSGINSMAAVTLEDFVKGTKRGRKMSDGEATLLSKMMVCGYGLMATAMSFAAGPLGGLIRASLSGIGALSGPVIGVFLLGLFVPRGNKVGALCGLLFSASITLWLLVGGFVTMPYKDYKLPLNASCFDDITVYDPASYGDMSVSYPYRISQYLYPLIGMGLSLVVGTVVSYLPGFWFEFVPGAHLTYYGRNQIHVSAVQHEQESKL